ncbi:MAG: hypothetical protein LQ345_006850 [Seirophora villosa]|nr:MAG: hypothetical protein LQ345_006850 [Seirophora villosa]
MYQCYSVYAVCAFAAIGGGLFGFDISSMSGVLATQAYMNFFKVHGRYRQGAITGSMPGGSFFGTLASSFIADRMSRKTSIQIAAVIWIIGSIFQTAANGVAMLVFGRAVAGIGAGIASAMVPVYQAEIAPKEIRGRVVALQQWAITWGILIQYFIQYGASFVDGGPKNPHQSTMAFRIPWGVQIFPAVLLAVGMFFVPYSPRWLAGQDRWEESIRVLANLHGHGDIGHPKVLAQYREIEDAMTFEREAGGSAIKVLTQPRMFSRVVLVVSIQMWSQLGGMNVMMYYIVYMMQAAGVHDILLTASIQYILNVALTLPAILFIDTWGRRPSLLYGAFSMMTLLFAVAALSATYGILNPRTDPSLDAVSWLIVDHPAVSRAIVACSYLFVCTFALTWGPTSWTYPSEIFPTGIRAKAVSLATASNWAWNCALAFAVPTLFETINWKMYILFAVFNLCAFVHVWLTVRETKGKTLEEMEEVFESGRPAWKGVSSGSRLDKLQRDIAEGRVKVNFRLRPRRYEPL